MRIAVVCRDMRMRYAAEVMNSWADVYLVETAADMLQLPLLDALVLPVGGMDAQGNIAMQDGSLHIPASFWHIQGKRLRVYSGTTQKAKECHADITCYMQDEQLIDQNALLTAEGVLYELIGCTAKSIYALQVDIVGYGHCGKAIYQLLKNLHIAVRVIRRQADTRADMLATAAWEQCGDVIIYTALGQLIDEAMLKRWQKHPIILDIATPKLFDEALLQRYGIKYKRLPGLPGRFASRSGGMLIADHVRRKLCAEG